MIFKLICDQGKIGEGGERETKGKLKNKSEKQYQGESVSVRIPYFGTELGMLIMVRRTDGVEVKGKEKEQTLTF